jgi:hypothetical protein
VSDPDRIGWTCCLTTLTVGEVEGRGRRRSPRETHRPAVVVMWDGEPTDFFVLRRSATEVEAQPALADVEAGIAASASAA